ncbi:MAG: ATP-binding protein [Porphyromonadaceae bacterium]|nr:MAG: ATP-binding protein [Porphyromonadaceae bacterium]
MRCVFFLQFIRFGVEDFESLYQAFLELDNPQGKKYFFLDELQVIPGWERWVHRMYEFEDVKMFITGSNSSLSNSVLSSALTGRNRELRIHPFSFREYLGMNGIYEVAAPELLASEKTTRLKREFTTFSQLGGFPEVVKNRDVTITDAYFKDIMHRDVITRHQIRNAREIRELCLYLITNSGNLLSYESLRKMLQVKSVSTIRNYLEILKEVFLVQSLSKYAFSIKKQIFNPDKYYVTDLGFYQSLGFRFSENLGKVLENIVFHQLIRFHDDLYYWSSASGKKVDFLVREKSVLVEAIQVTYDLNPENRDRELAGLIAAGRELGISRLTVLTHDQEDLIRLGQFEIEVIPVWKWLLLR